MSRADGLRFIEKTNQDPRLYDRMTAAFGKPKQLDGQHYARVAELARSEGYDASEDDLRAAFIEYRASLAARQGELNDAELEAIAGGYFVNTLNLDYPDACPPTTP